jgi:hypothetical protein
VSPDLPLAERLTRPERTGFLETSSYAEVVEWLEAAAREHPSLHLTRFGYTNEGRALPLLVAGTLPDVSASALREAGVPVVYLQGNIHAGEVAGKEALLRLVRRLASGEMDEALAEVILLVAPIYNADGNERLSLRNRPRQHGPLGGMGTRANAQGLDLNRDQMKLDSPEARSLAALLSEYEPDVVVDLHTTNGTRHAYHLTYSPPLHPATPAEIDGLLREALLPRVTERIEARYGWHFWHYGNVSTRNGVRGWYTFDHRPRFVTNYAGLRNRIGILSEAYSYATFQDRVLASERFVDEILDWVRGHPELVRRVVREADALDLRGTELPVRAAFPGSAPAHEILMGEVVEERHPWTGAPILRRTGTIAPDVMPAFVAFEGTERERVPDAYLVPVELSDLLDRLRAHGVRTLEAGAGTDGESRFDGRVVEAFRVTALRRADREFQARHEVELLGQWGEVDPEGLEGAFVEVPMDQPLARLAFLLLEPRADDGFANWGLLDPWLEEGADYPIRRRLAPEEREPLARDGPRTHDGGR